MGRLPRPFLPSAPVIITGARGRLASHLASALEAAGVDVIRVSRRAGEGHLSYEELDSSGLFTRAAALVHCAWSSLPSTAEKDPGSVQREDLPLLGQLLRNAAGTPRPESMHFIFLSSGGAVYGECTQPAVETDPLAPVGWYGRGKVEAEKLLFSRHAGAGPAVCVLRPSNPYGFRHAPEKPQGIVGAALNAVRTGRPLQLLGGGASYKDFLHVADFEAAVLDCLSFRLTGTYNVCCGTSIRTLDLIREIEESGGITVPRTDVPDVSWDVHRSMLSPAKLTSATGWRPTRSLREGLREAIRDAGFSVAG